ncbi:hypothetical protein [Oribacterium sp. oral taxon 078]|uniref:hypothetical protein n=1 Tax=Oribacterium sp. oral taxon 078 TaxID=652706 RepID=UPI0012DC739F|nr:hypothetical protein [Oribacterium sp. oral taxon 078]
MSNIRICPRGHWFSRSRSPFICPVCGFRMDSPERRYFLLRARFGLSVSEERPCTALLLSLSDEKAGGFFPLSFGLQYLGSGEADLLYEPSLLKRHAAFYYDETKRCCSLLPARGRGIVRLEGEMVHEAAVLRDKMILELSGKRFRYLELDGKYGRLWGGILRTERGYRERAEREPEFREHFSRYKKEREEDLRREREERWERLRKEEGQEREERGAVEGFLLCIDGAGAGRLWALYDGWNRIGSGALMEISLPSSPGLREKEHAVIYIIGEEKRALLLGEKCRGLVRLQGKAGYRTALLRNGDILELGASRLLYIGILL